MLSLFDKYGGFSTVSLIVRSFYKEVLASQALKPYFEGINIEGLISHQTKLFSQILGGPASYNGRELAAAHAHLKISESAFNEVAEILQEALEDHGVESDDVVTIMNIIGGVKSQIVVSD